MCGRTVLLIVFLYSSLGRLEMMLLSLPRFNVRVKAHAKNHTPQLLGVYPCGSCSPTPNSFRGLRGFVPENILAGAFSPRRKAFVFPLKNISFNLQILCHCFEQEGKHRDRVKMLQILWNISYNDLLIYYMCVSVWTYCVYLFLNFFCMYSACAFICVCAPLVRLVPKDTIRGQWIPGIVVIDIGELLCRKCPMSGNWTGTSGKNSQCF